MAMGNRKVRLGITELVWEKADNGNGEPYGKVGDHCTGVEESG